jgi:hypothetical protein
MAHGTPSPEVLAYYSAFLKEVYDDYIRDNATKKTIFLDELERTTDFTVSTPFGLQFYVPIMLGLPQGHNTTGESGVLPNQGRTTGGGATFTPVQQTGRIGFTFRAQNVGDNKTAVWQGIPTLEMDNIVKWMRQSINRQIYSNGTGVVATCTATGSSNTLTISDTTKYLFAQANNGVYIDISRATIGDIATNRQVLSKTSTSITISGAAVAVNTGDVVSFYGSYGSEMLGLGAVIGSTVYGTAIYATINPATAGNEEWQSIIVNASNAAVSVPLMDQVIMPIEDNNGEVSFIVCDSSTFRVAAAVLTAYRRIPVVETPQLSGGHKGIDWNGIPLIRDGRDCPVNTAWFIDKEIVKFAEISDGGWQDLGGDIIHWDGQRGYTAIWIWDMNMVAHSRNRLGLLYGLVAA